MVLDFCDLKKLFGRFENFFWVDDYQLFIEVHKVLKVFSRVRIEKVGLVLVSKKVYISIMKSYYSNRNIFNKEYRIVNSLLMVKVIC